MVVVLVMVVMVARVYKNGGCSNSARAGFTRCGARTRDHRRVVVVVTCVVSGGGVSNGGGGGGVVMH